MDQRLQDPAGAAPPDWRGLCEELVDELHGYASANPHHDSDALVARARAALAAEPVGEGPSDEELLATLDNATADFPPRHPEAEALNAVEYPLALELRKARAVLARYGHQPAPPAAGEVAELVEFLRDWGDDYADEGTEWHRAADLLERQAAPVPVAVSERLPGPEDLNDKGECWEWDPASDAWVLLRPNGLIFRPGPWLPAHALPLPAGEVQP